MFGPIHACLYLFTEISVPLSMWAGLSAAAAGGVESAVIG